MHRQTLVRGFLLVLLMYYEDVDSGPILGPVEVELKYLEKCKWTSPTAIDTNIRVYQRRKKIVANLNVTFPFLVSDDMGYDVNMAVKKSGAWIPNFLKFKGKGICSILEAGEKDLFKMLATQLKAKDVPPRCPLPAGAVNITYEGADPNALMKQYGIDVMPYGEFRITANITHKRDTIVCIKAFVDFVPKKGKSG